MANTITESDVRRIAKEEVTLALKNMNKELRRVCKVSDENKHILERLERLLLGEAGMEETDTLKARANFAYQYAKMNTDAKIIQRAEPALKWFEDMAQVEPGQKESKLDALGRIIALFKNLEWLIALIGITTIVNAIPIIKDIVGWIENTI